MYLCLWKNRCMYTHQYIMCYIILDRYKYIFSFEIDHYKASILNILICRSIFINPFIMGQIKQLCLKSTWNDSLKQKMSICQIYYVSFKIIFSICNALLPMFFTIIETCCKVIFVKPLQILWRIIFYQINIFKITTMKKFKSWK